MANPHGTETAALTSAAALKQRLLSKGERYAFFQAYRLLRLLEQNRGGKEVDLRARPSLSLHFPGTDLNAIHEAAPGAYRLTVNFLGLYGVTSPLPNFYTEDLLDEQHDGRHSNRDFLDIINQTLYPLFFRAWLKSRAHMRIKEFGDTRLLEIFHTFVGINRPLRHLSRPGFSHLLRFAGLFSQFPRSAMGLRTIVAGLFPSTRVELIQQDELWQPIPPDQHLQLGMQACSLGDDSHLGSTIRSRSSNLTIRISDVDQDLFLQLLPGQSEYRKLQAMVRYYLLDPLHVRLNLRLKAHAVRPIGLGQAKWAGLGRDSWLVASGYKTPVELHVTL